MTEPLRVAGEREPLPELHIDVRRVKPAILKEVQAKLGEPLSMAARKPDREVDIVWAFAYAVGRRLDPELTWDEAGEIDVWLEGLAEGPPVPPTSGAG